MHHHQRIYHHGSGNSALGRKASPRRVMCRRRDQERRRRSQSTERSLRKYGVVATSRAKRTYPCKNACMLANDCIALIIFLWTTLYIRVVILMAGGTEAPKEYWPKPMEWILYDFTVPSNSKFPSSTTHYTASTVPTVPTVLKFNSSNTYLKFNSSIQFNSSPWPLSSPRQGGPSSS